MANKKQQQHPCDGCEKDKKHCRDCEHKEARAMQLADIDRMRREVQLDMMTKELPYERLLYINAVKSLVKAAAENILEAGKMLLIIHEKEKGNFRQIVEEQIQIPHTTAYRWMNAAAKSASFPKIEWGQVSHVGHVYALLEAPEEDLKQLEDKGILAGKDMDELNRLSVKDMRNLIKELKAEREFIAKGIEKEMKAEKKALENEIKRLSAFEPTNPDPKAIEIFKQVDEHLDEVDRLLRHFVKIPFRELETATIGKVEGFIKRINSRLEMWDRDWAAGEE